VADQPFSLSTRPPEVAFTSRVVQPPAPVYVGPDEHIAVHLLNTLTGAIVDVNLRFLRPDGQIVPIVHRFAPTADGAVNLFPIELGEGFVLSMSAWWVTGAPGRGRTYLMATLRRGASALGQPFSHVLMAGYVGYPLPLQGPHQPLQHPREGPGYVHRENVNNPAAGADWSITVPVARIWSVIAVTCLLQTDATAANRNVNLQVHDAGTQVYQVNPATAVPALTLAGLSWCPAGQLSALAGVYTAALPVPCMVPGGWTIKSNTVGLQAADQFSGINLWVEEWIGG
jgi:hypothetical protein